MKSLSVILMMLGFFICLFESNALQHQIYLYLIGGGLYVIGGLTVLKTKI
jgi:hypothetical protein